MLSPVTASQRRMMFVGAAGEQGAAVGQKTRPTTLAARGPTSVRERGARGLCDRSPLPIRPMLAAASKRTVGREIAIEITGFWPGCDLARRSRRPGAQKNKVCRRAPPGDDLAVAAGRRDPR